MVSSGGGPSAAEAERRWWPVAMTVRVKGGYDPDYYFRQMGGKDAQTGSGRGPDVPMPRWVKSSGAGSWPTRPICHDGAGELASGFRLAAPRLDRLDTESAFELEG
jgi:hypothetical protein